MNDRDMGRRPILFTDVGAKLIVGACVIEADDGMILMLSSSMSSSSGSISVAAARPTCTLLLISRMAEKATVTTKRYAGEEMVRWRRIIMIDQDILLATRPLRKGANFDSTACNSESRFDLWIRRRRIARGTNPDKEDLSKKKK